MRLWDAVVLPTYHVGTVRYLVGLYWFNTLTPHSWDFSLGILKWRFSLELLKWHGSMPVPGHQIWRTKNWKTNSTISIEVKVKCLQGIVLCQFTRKNISRYYSMIAALAQWKSNPLPFSSLFSSYHEQSLHLSCLNICSKNVHCVVFISRNERVNLFSAVLVYKKT